MKNPPAYDGLPTGKTLAGLISPEASASGIYKGDVGPGRLKIRDSGVLISASPAFQDTVVRAVNMPPEPKPTESSPHDVPKDMTPEQFVFWIQGVFFAARNGLIREQQDNIRAALSTVKTGAK